MAWKNCFGRMQSELLIVLMLVICKVDLVIMQWTYGFSGALDWGSSSSWNYSFDMHQGKMLHFLGLGFFEGFSKGLALSMPHIWKWTNPSSTLWVVLKWISTFFLCFPSVMQNSFVEEIFQRRVLRAFNSVFRGFCVKLFPQRSKRIRLNVF